MGYVDSSRPELVEGFTKKTLTAMIEGVREAALAAEMTDRSTFDKGIQDFYRTIERDGSSATLFSKQSL